MCVLQAGEGLHQIGRGRDHGAGRHGPGSAAPHTPDGGARRHWHRLSILANRRHVPGTRDAHCTLGHALADRLAQQVEEIAALRQCPFVLVHVAGAGSTIPAPRGYAARLGCIEIRQQPFLAQQFVDAPKDRIQRAHDRLIEQLENDEPDRHALRQALQGLGKGLGNDTGIERDDLLGQVLA